MSRKSARANAFRLVFQLPFSDADPKQIYENYLSSNQALDRYEISIICNEFFGICQNIEAIDSVIEQNSKWETERLNKIDLALIRLGIYEINYEKNKAVIVMSEIADLASKYGTDKSPNFVNGILAEISYNSDENE